ncbi:MAG: hypothetical protein NW224_18705 [Leptolyngbyaceae cyanobacterium bins.302]|nr:hypothetical protein [Leptolyngbyaceae cyanobacterium bins.302]
MVNNESPKTKQIEIAINVLTQALQKLDEHDYPSAKVMTGVAKKVLDDLQLDLDRHLYVEEKLKQLLK